MEGQVTRRGQATEFVDASGSARFLIGYRGFRSLGFVGGSSEKIFAMDVDLAQHRVGERSRVEFQLRHVSPLSRWNDLEPDPSHFRRIPGCRGSSAASGGQPGQVGSWRTSEGAVTLKERARQSSAAPTSDDGPGRRTAPPSTNPFAPLPQYLHAVDGRRQVPFVLCIQRRRTEPADPVLAAQCKCPGPDRV